jgi:multiple sugar transport system substrate-binding protein
MKRGKKASVFYLGFILVLIMFVTPTLKAEKVAVTVWVGDWWKSKVPAIVEKFEKENPNISLKIELVANNAYMDKAITAILGGSPPDVIDLDTFMIGSMAARGFLQEWAKKDLPKLGNLDDFSKGAWNAGIYQGKLYAIPNRVTSQVFFYNKKLFDAAGVAYPNEKWTYQDMLEMAKKLTIPGKQYGLGIAASLDNPANVISALAPIVWSFGGDFFDKNYTKCRLNEPNAIKGLQFWADLLLKHKVVPEGIINYTSTKDIVPLFVNDKIAMIPTGEDGLQAVEARPDFRLGMEVFPGNISVGRGWSFTVPVSAAHPAEARQFIAWFVKPENLGPLMPRTPARMSANNVAPWTGERYKKFNEASAVSRSLPVTPFLAETQTIIITQMQKVLEGKQTVAQAAKEITDQVNVVLKQKI